ncbi:MAG: deoxyhypusine hydroxylase [Trichoglossum hirsutum]|nr:MAG: deoxyhypusine hydroxylase [Trichoglossum hirsutum]
MAPAPDAPAGDSTIDILRAELLQSSHSEPSLSRSYRALFSLKSLASAQPATGQTLRAIQAIAAGFSSPSALLRHEVAYCLGQTRNAAAAAPFLRAALQDRSEDAMCRHEAAEALGALGDVESLAVLRAFRDDEMEEVVVRETCEIAVARLEWEQDNEEKPYRSVFASVDPAPPLLQTSQKFTIPDLQAVLLNTELPLFQRYRAMFALRDLSSPPDLPTAVPAIEALSTGFTDPSPLFRHEIAFVFGQLSHPASIPYLVSTLENMKEASMVRHEAAEALGGLGNEAGVEEVLKRFLNDGDRVVRESVVVALDMADFEKSGELEYALIPEKVEVLDPS